MKKRFKIGTALALSVLFNIMPTNIKSVKADDLESKTNIVENVIEKEIINENQFTYDDSLIPVEEPLEVKEITNGVSTAEAHNIEISEPARAPTEEETTIDAVDNVNNNETVENNDSTKEESTIAKQAASISEGKLAFKGTQKLNSHNDSKVQYTLNYSFRVKNYNGKLMLRLVDRLPYATKGDVFKASVTQEAIDKLGATLNTSQASYNTLTWDVLLENNVYTYDDEGLVISGTYEFELEYTDMPTSIEGFSNDITVNIVTYNTDESSIEQKENVVTIDTPKSAYTSYNWNIDKSKTASDLNDAEETKITISLPSGEVKNTAEVIFVLDKSTYSDYPSTIDNSLSILEDLRKSEASVRVAIVHFNRIGHPSEWFDVQTQYDEIVEALKVKYSGGSNMHAGLLAAQKLLNNSTDVEDNNKYVVLISDGSVYLHCKNGDYTTPYTRSYVPVESAAGTAYGGFWMEGYWNPYVKAGIEAGNVTRPKTPDADLWESYLADVEARNNESNGDQYDYVWMYYDATTPEGRAEGYIETPREPRTASNMDIAYLHCYETWKQLQGKYHTYAIGVNDTGAGEGNWDSSKAFMRFLNNNEEPNFDKIRKDLFLLSKGSKVIDYIGDNFDFINDKERIVVKVGEEVLTPEEISENLYGFGKNEDDTYKYTVEYVPGKDEHLVWNINENVSNYSHTQLIFFEQLVNKEENMGTYIIPTNNEAILYPIDSEGLAGETELFPVPKVSYDVIVNGTVIIHYIDKHGVKLRDDDTLTGIVGEEYNTLNTKLQRDEEIVNEKGYIYLTSTGKTQGTFTHERPINVTYIYEKYSKVIVKYIDKDTNLEVAKEEVVKGNEGTSYVTASKQVEHYDLVGEPDNKYGTFTEEDQTVIYYYVKHNGKVIVHHIDKDTNEDITTTEEKGKVDDEYTTKSIEIPKYTVTDDIPENKDGKFTEKDIHVNYYYTKNKGKVIVHYIDNETKTEFENSKEEIIDKLDKEYHTEEKEFEGYHRVNIEGETDGIITEVEKEVSYYYERNEANATVIHYDVDTNDELGRDTYNGKVGDTYTTVAKEFEYYEQIDPTPSTVERTFVDGTTTINYYYKKYAGEVNVFYYDLRSGEEIANREHYAGKVDKTYETAKKDLPGYRYVRVTGKTEGNFEKNHTEIVNYYYDKVGYVIAKYVDSKTLKEIVERYNDEGIIGEAYTTKEKNIEGYTLVELPSNKDGRFTEESHTTPIEVIYYYNQLGQVKVYYVDKNNNSLIDKEFETIPGIVGEEYQTAEKQIEGYTLFTVISDEENNARNGVISVSAKKVIYIYEKEETQPEAALVTIKYVDEETEKEISPRTYLEGNVGDKYKVSYKEIEGYEYSKVDGEEISTFSEEDKTITYYYTKKEQEDDSCHGNCCECQEDACTTCPYGLVVTKYEDEAGNTIHEQNVEKVNPNGQYTTTKLIIDGYEFVRVSNDSDPVEGVYVENEENKPITVTYVYKKIEETEAKDANLIVKYVSGNTELYKEVKAYKIGDFYFTTRKQFDGYIFVDVDSAEEGYIQKELTTIIYTYEKIEETPEEPVVEPKNVTLLVQYLDKDTKNPVYDSMSLSGKEGETYTIIRKAKEGYNLLEPEFDELGVYSENKTLTYYYERIEETPEEPIVEPKEVTLLVQYLDKDTKNPVYDSMSLSGKEGETYTIIRKAKEGYNLLEPEFDELGEYSESKVLTYYYERIKKETTTPEKAYILVHYVDKDKNPIISDDLVTGTVGEGYTIPTKVIEGYSLVDIEKEEAKPATRLAMLKAPLNTISKANIGTFTEGTTEIYFIYEKLEEDSQEEPTAKEAAMLIVHHIDKDGTAVAEDDVQKGLEGDFYNASQKVLKGYKFVSVDAEETNGKLKAGQTVITYTYEKTEEETPSDDQQGNCNCNNCCSCTACQQCNNSCPCDQPSTDQGKENNQPVINIDITINNENNSDNHSENNNENTVDNHADNHNENQNENNSDNHADNHTDISYEDNSDNHTDVNVDNHADNHNDTTTEVDNHSDNHTDVSNDTNVDNHNDNTTEVNNDNSTDVNNENNNQDENNVNIENNPVNTNDVDNNTNVENNPTNNVENNTTVENNPTNNNESSSTNNIEQNPTITNEGGSAPTNVEVNPTINVEGAENNNTNNNEANPTATAEGGNSTSSNNNESNPTITVEGGDNTNTSSSESNPTINVDGGNNSLNNESNPNVNVEGGDNTNTSEQNPTITNEGGDNSSNIENNPENNNNNENTDENTNNNETTCTDNCEKTRDDSSCDKEENTNPKKGIVVANYLDKEGRVLVASEITSDDVEKEYTTTQKDIPNYTFKNVEGEPTGKYVEGVYTVNYYYEKENESTIDPTPENGTVVVYYIDTKGNTLAEKEVIEDQVGKAYLTDQKTFEEYDFVAIIGNKNGTVEKGITEVTYLYQKETTCQKDECDEKPVCPSDSCEKEDKTGKIIARYIDNKGNTLTEEIVTEDKVGENYVTLQKSFDGYNFVTVTGNRSGKYVDGVIEVTYVYQPTEHESSDKSDESEKPEEKTGKVIIHYVDDEGNTLLTDKEIEGKVDKTYTSQKEDIKNYSLIAIKGEETITFKEETQEITYVYKRNIGKVIAHYVDIKGNMIGYDQSSEGFVEDNYTTNNRRFRGYELVQIVGAATGKYQNGTIEVTYIYQKEESKPEPAPEDKNNNADNNKNNNKTDNNEIGGTASVDYRKTYTGNEIKVPNTGITYDNTASTYLIALVAFVLSLIAFPISKEY